MSSRDGSGFNNAMMQLRKICNHPYLFLNEWYADEDMVRASGKFELLDRMLPKLKAAGHRVLMFSQMTQVMTILERFFDYKQFQYLRLDGATSSEEREKRMYMFNHAESPYFIFLLSTRAGGLGLNLATADTVIIFDSDWNPMMDAQAQDRAHRIGQRNEVRVFRLVTNSPIEERILARATDKKNLNSLAIESGQFNKSQGSSSGEDKKEMMTSLLKEWSEGLGNEVDVDLEKGLDIPDDEQINQMMTIQVSDLEIYQAMDVEREKMRLAKWRERQRALGVKEKDLSLILPSRLMAADEVPTWITDASWSTKGMHDALTRGDSSEALAAKAAELAGGRKRKDVVYDDGMTDDQYCRAMEHRADALEMEVKKARQDEQIRRAEMRARASGQDEMTIARRMSDEVMLISLHIFFSRPLLDLN